MNVFMLSNLLTTISDGEISLLEQIIIFLGAKMETPTPYGWFHLLGIALIIVACVLAFLFARNVNEKQLNLILGITAIVLVVLEIYKQFTFSYQIETDTWSYHWFNAFPFQFCATPMYAMLIACFLKEGKLKDSICAYLATFGMFAGLVVILYPVQIFISTIGINIHALLHHAAMVIMGIVMYVTGRAKLSYKTILKALPVFVVFVSLALLGNHLYWVYLYPITEQVCNLFYISPYFPCTLPLLGDFIYGNVPYVVFLLIYVLGFTLAGYIMTLLATGFSKLYTLFKKRTPGKNAPAEKTTV